MKFKPMSWFARRTSIVRPPEPASRRPFETDLTMKQILMERQPIDVGNTA